MLIRAEACSAQEGRGTLGEKVLERGDTGDMAQVVAHLPSKCKALSLIPSTAEGTAGPR
jgi:hypothetical protein